MYLNRIIWWSKYDKKIVILKSNPVSHHQELAWPSKLSDGEKMLIWQPEPMLKACVNIAPESKLSHPVVVRGCHLRHFVKPGLRYLSDISSNKLFFARISTVLYHHTVKSLSDDVELCYLSHIATCQMFSETLYLVFCRKTVNLGLKMQITQFRMKECGMLVYPRTKSAIIQK